MSRGKTARFIAATAFAGWLIGVGTGCVERRYTIRTDPPGALVYVNREEVGSAPVSKSFTYYGPRDILLVADGYQTTRLVQPIEAPWWDNLFTEFVAENIIPFHLRDEREFFYKMEPQSYPPQTDILNRAEMLRARGQVPPPPLRGGLGGYLGWE